MRTKTLLMEDIERELGRPLEEIIAEMTRRGQSREQIARHLGVSYFTLQGWLRKLGATFETTVSFQRDLSTSGVE